ncbi:4'-phosphopantetheinyl transferase superfamily protein [Aquimarina sp. D1M17]|uniref:4'-phosphopantetheinyl transferase family protein n=1 Tax=Aquimarina acroporae TaxID=2937283 RepID=UPI0020C02682|nr:4'-phosphopantetheinyl transferase superfamily protein [Aquimarina acroporae]MCK8520060.1 4'-phosphopantetheinyl transferase superfamily protein [Aquimarina acroporae]
MIGNDIVDLKLAQKQSNWQRKGWLQKIFTLREQEQIQLAKQPELEVWKLWSRKEAAYKVHQRRFNLQPKYNPKSLECVDHLVQIDDSVYNCETQLTDDWVYSIATSSSKNPISKVFDHNRVRDELKLWFSDFLSIPESSCSIVKNLNRIPLLRTENGSEFSNFSITHHGDFSAFSIDL